MPPMAAASSYDNSSVGICHAWKSSFWSVNGQKAAEWLRTDLEYATTCSKCTSKYEHGTWRLR